MQNRRKFLHTSTLAVTAMASGPEAQADTTGISQAGDSLPQCHPLFTPADEFRDVSRGNPKPHSLIGQALVDARLTPESWRLEIIADPFTNDIVKQPAQVEKQLTLAEGTAIDLPMLKRLGESCGVRYVKAVQCLNIPEPLGQGLWEGVPLRNVLQLCGELRNVRRIYYHGFHNEDPKQLFQSSLSYAQAMESAPGDPPVFLAYQLNGAPISPLRGGPVRMIVPWAYGFKSIKWLQRITLTNDFRANDTYAEQNNDPESPMKTAAYLDKLPSKYPAGQTIFVTGQVIAGFSGLERVEYQLQRLESGPAAEIDNDGLSRGEWIPCTLESEPSDWSQVLPGKIPASDVLGFDRNTQRARSWPLRYGMASWNVALRNLEPGQYEMRVRAVDLNGFAQPEPRPMLKAGKNAVGVHRFEVTREGD